MALLKMGVAARRARAGSANKIRRALQEAGVPMVTRSPGEYAVEEADLERYLQERRTDAATEPRPKKRPTGKTKKVDRRR